jgi:aminoglycoside phosphotransferase (APT) family kinase protein
MEKGDLIGKGRTAEIFAWGDRQALKLFFDWCPAAWAEEEAELTKAVHDAGVPAPDVGDLIQVEGRWGLILERIEGPSMLHELRSKPSEYAPMARLLADLQAAMHAHQVPGLPSYKQSLRSAIIRAAALPPHLKQAALQALDKLPDGTALCHGDFHPDNVILSPHGPMILDWTAAVTGSPLADAARTSLLLGSGQLPPDVPQSERERIEALRSGFHSAWLQHYLDLRQASREEVAAWELPVTAGRLNEEISGEQDSLLGRVESLSSLSSISASGGN